jgi:PERQ amino acid-rich with GYF domain-containing protein
VNNVVNNRTRLKTSASKVLTDDKPTINRNGSAKANVPWSGVAAGAGKSTAIGGGMSANQSAGGPRRGGFEISAAEGGSGILGGGSRLKKSSDHLNGKQEAADMRADIIDDKPAPLFHNSGGRKYSAQEMLKIWEEMKTKDGGGNFGHFKSSYSKVKSPNDLFYSATANNPVSLDQGPKDHERRFFQRQLEPAAVNAFSDTPMGAAAGSATGSVAGITSNGPDEPRSSILPNVPTTWSPFGNLGITGTPPGEKINPSEFFAKSVTATPPPPGIPSPQPSLVYPDAMQWLYKDPSGVEQGPFSGKMMHDWYVGNWLTEDLLIRRVEEPDFVRLYDFKVKIGNFSEPFLVPLPVIGRPPYDVLRQQPLHQQLASIQLQPTANAWGSPVSTPMSPMSPWTQPHGYPVHPQPAKDPGFISSPVPDDDLWEKPIREPLADVKSVELEPQLDPQPEVAVAREVGPIGKPEEIVEEAVEEVKRKVEKIENKLERVNEQLEDEVQEKVVPAMSPKRVVKKKLTIAKGESDESANVNGGVTRAVAPWAKKEQIVVKPSAPSLKEIQELEAAQRKKLLKQQQHQQQQQQQQQQLAVNLAKSGSAKTSGPSLPSGATWALTGKVEAAPKKTLAEIQKEEEMEAKRLAQSQTQASATVVLPAGGKRYAEIGRSSQPATTAPVASGPWTTVGPGGRKVSSPTPPTQTPAVQIVKRVPSAAVVRPAVAPTNPSPSSEEFLQWCKVSLQGLNAGISATELLSMLLSLPATPDSREIIAETIYSNSSTMDGRRFADEFLKRRNAAEKEKVGDSWSDVLQRSTVVTKPVENDGWNPAFKVVAKKKKKAEQA